MANDLCEGVFNQILLRTAKNDHFETIFQLCASPCPTFSGQLDFFNFPPTSYLSIRLKLEKIWLVLVHSKQSYASKAFTGGSYQPPPAVQEGLMTQGMNARIAPIQYVRLFQNVTSLEM